MRAEHGGTRAPWAQPASAVLEGLGADSRGMASAAATERLAQFGPNTLPQAGRLGLLRIFLSQFKSPILLILLIAGSVTLLLREWGDSAVILGAVLVNALLGLYQEAKAENTLALLNTYVKDRARVLRDGRERLVEASQLVPGDVVQLNQGDRVPADVRLIAAADLQVDESILTGESLPVDKGTDPVGEDVPLGDRASVAYSGTTVVQGYATAVVTGTGTATEIGRIATLIAEAHREQTPLQKALLRFTYRATIVLSVLTTVLFLYGIYSGRSPLEMFLISVATAVAAVPEGLPVALTVILAIGVERLARKKGVVRKLLAAETLGSTTVVMTDKTGTLTEAKMELESVLPFSKSRTEAELLEFAVSHSDVLIENPEEAPESWQVVGRPVEVALARGSARFGVHLPTVRSSFEVVERLPFNSSNKYAASVVRRESEAYVVLFGAPEALLARSRADAELAKLATDRVDELASGGARVLAVAAAQLAGGGSLASHVESRSAEFLGLITFRDPIRPSVRDAIARVEAAGVRTLIVTGDHAGTALTVAHAVGIPTDVDGSVLTGPQVDSLGDDELRERLKVARVIARTTPEHKLRIARAFKALGEVVAMTGDGVNDAPALREADIGVAVGSGSDVAKSSADLVILDDNFETIVAAIEEGRNVLQNVRKVIAYTLSNAFDGLLLIGGSMVLGIPLPLNTLQILWVNLFTDSFPAMALAFEENRGDVGRGPVRIHRNLFDAELKFLVLVIGTITSALLFALYVLLLRLDFDPQYVRTFIFASFGVYTLFLVFAVRSLRASVVSYPLLSNRYLVVGTGIGFAMMAAVIYLPPLQRIFDTVPLSLPWVGGVFAVGLASVALVEFGKWLFRPRHLRHAHA